LLREQRRAEECFIVGLFWFLKLESSMAMRFFASCWSGFPLFVIFFSSFGLVYHSLSFFSLLVWFKFFFLFFSVGLVCGGGEGRFSVALCCL
jgi:hypothetical protein